MYGTVARMKAKPGEVGALVALFQEDAPTPSGYVTSYVYRLDNAPDDVMVSVVFEDKKTYFANADTPETDAWYRRVRALLAEDPEWNDGEIVFAG